MVSPVGPKDLDIVIKFGGGLHTRASEDEIDPREAADGANFQLDLENRELRNRKPFDLIGTVPNGAEIRGGFTLLKADGTVSTCIQAGAIVYEWDGSTGFTPIGNVNALSKLRGHWRSHQWTLDDKVLITDLALLETIKEWDGTTFQSTTFTNEASSAFGTFYAKYLHIADERAIFSHVRDAGQTTPHMIVGSLRSDYTIITVTDRPSSSLSEADPFFLLTPDLKPINGHEEAFGTTIISTERGKLFNLSGSSAKDFSFDEFYPGSAASGAEAMSYIGNDIIYARPGRVESVRDTDRFGDSEANDLTKAISDRVEGYNGGRIVFNSRLSRVYWFPDGISECWVLYPALRDDGKMSPWTKWTTNHPLAFQPTFVMSMLDPADGLEYVFMGDNAGRWYRLEGSGEGDGGSTDIAVDWLSKLFSMPLGADVNSVEGYLKYRKNVAATVRITFRFAGQTATDEAVEVTIPAITGTAHFGGDHWFGGDTYFGVRFENRLLRQKVRFPGQNNDFQVRIQVEGSTDFALNELGFRFKGTSK